MILDLDLLSATHFAKMLYRLQFPNRDYWKLPHSVRCSYETDGEQLLKMLREYAS